MRLVNMDASADDVKHGLRTGTPLRGVIPVSGIDGERAERGGREKRCRWQGVEGRAGAGIANDDQRSRGDQGDCGSQGGGRD